MVPIATNICDDALQSLGNLGLPITYLINTYLTQTDKHSYILQTISFGRFSPLELWQRWRRLGYEY